MSERPSLRRRAAVEAVGTAALVAVVVGSGIQATRLTPDVGTQLLANSLATVFGLAVLITWCGPLSGAHFNPAVSLADWIAGRRTGAGLSLPELGVYAVSQTTGAVAGAVLANAMFAEPLVAWSVHDRSAGHLWLSEGVATAGLVAVVFGLVRTGRDRLAPVAVAAWIGAAYWSTASTSFANPAVTVGRAFTDTFAGIAPASVGPFVIAQLLGAVAGLGLAVVLTGRTLRAAPATGPEAADDAGATGGPVPAAFHH
ncbi:aquaporin [Streptomyces erythrochromogenes]|uniref:aquaporin n=1 Tax=Streptomyces erythrochromogenes TaxID=285574 RepID=UPI0036A0A677